MVSGVTVSCNIKQVSFFFNTRCFLDVLELFDLKQHISGATHNRGHTLDLVIRRAHESGLISAFHVEDPCISDHFAVHCSLSLAKPPLERREISYGKIRSINYDQFWCDLENSWLVSDPLGLNLTDLVDLYGTLKSLLDTHASLMRKIIIIRPFSPRYTDDIRSEKRKCRAFERRWRASRGDLDYQHYKEQGIIVNNKIKSAKVGFYSDLIHENNCHQKTLFATVNSLLHRKPPIDYPSSCSSDCELANKFVEFCSDKIVVL